MGILLAEFSASVSDASGILLSWRNGLGPVSWPRRPVPGARVYVDYITRL